MTDADIDDVVALKIEIDARDEGPSPKGVANRLHRERDEARRERDALELELKAARDDEQRYWLLIVRIANELMLTKPDGETVSLPLSLMRELAECYVDARGSVLGEDLDEYLTPDPE